MTLTPEQRSSRGRLWREELDTFPARAVTELLEYLARWAIPLTPATLSVPVSGEHVGLSWTLRDLVSYARTGAAGDWDDSGSAADALNDVSILCESPLDSATQVPTDWTSDATHDGVRGELAEVARAVLARINLAQRSPIPRAWLAALAGVDGSEIRRAITRGKLATEKPRKKAKGGKAALDVEVESARAWLVARGVEGVS